MSVLDRAKRWLADQSLAIWHTIRRTGEPMALPSLTAGPLAEGKAPFMWFGSLKEYVTMNDHRSYPFVSAGVNGELS